MRKTVGTLLGKSAAKAVSLRGKSGGQAFPGLVVETLIPGYLAAMLRQLPAGVTIITGTNGKTTTTKMVVEVLRAQGLRVLTNPTGSNLTRGIISSITAQASFTGSLPFDLAVFELDEAYAIQFTAAIKPAWVLALNASRDQLDRFGEVDAVARLIAETMQAARTGVIVNADDKRLSAAAANLKTSVRYFGVAEKLLKFFPRDDEIVSVDGHASLPQSTNLPLAVELLDFKEASATYKVGKEKLAAALQVTGQHNFQNAAGALALLQALLPDAKVSELLAQLSHVQPAFGRGQAFTLKNGSTLQLNLVKNPASFRQGLASYVQKDTQTMIAINDNLADSRDMSWLWDIDFRSLGDSIALTSGTRAADMALRLQYDDITVNQVEPNLEKALQHFCAAPEDKIIFASYTAMLRLYGLLQKQTGNQL
jgi:UDP-N-acetylmuramyl tripeptide synthase